MSFSRCRSLYLALGLTVLTCTFSSVVAQQARNPKVADQPGDITLKTKDGVQLSCRYYPAKSGETALPVILLHAWKGRGSDLSALASFLNGETAGGHAVIVPDLRGHGASIIKVDPSGEEKTLNLARFNRREIEQMVASDLEAVKKFLISEHNQRRLNIDTLCVVGAEMGAITALYWTAADWDWPRLAGKRQGQDVKAVVMISPPTGFKGASALKPLRHQAFRSDVAIQLLYGEDGTKETAAARRIDMALNKSREIDVGYDFRSFPTSLQGTRLFSEKQLNVAGFIARFIKDNVADRAESYPWEPRGSEVNAQ